MTEKIYTICLYIIIFPIIHFITQCDAPRKNPLDPENPDNIYHILEGKVKTVSLPAQPLPDVTVYWNKQTTKTQTNSEGIFSFETINTQNGWLRFEKEGYVSDSTYIQWNNDKKIFVEISLNALPSLDSLMVFSIILNRYPSLQKEQIAVEAKISDEDNDIDTVRVIINQIVFSSDLPFNTSNKWYQKTFSIFDLDIPRVERLVGHDFLIDVKDIFNHQFIVGRSTIERVIREEIIFISPAGNDTTSVNPTLIWQAFEPGFVFVYQLQVFTSEITPQLIWQKGYLDNNLTSYTGEMNLPPGEYFWVIWAIDEFGNRTRSKPASFIVK